MTVRLQCKTRIAYIHKSDIMKTILKISNYSYHYHIEINMRFLTKLCVCNFFIGEFFFFFFFCHGSDHRMLISHTFFFPFHEFLHLTVKFITMQICQSARETFLYPLKMSKNDNFQYLLTPPTNCNLILFINVCTLQTRHI